MVACPRARAVLLPIIRSTGTRPVVASGRARVRFSSTIVPSDGHGSPVDRAFGFRAREADRSPILESEMSGHASHIEHREPCSESTPFVHIHSPWTRRTATVARRERASNIAEFANSAMFFSKRPRYSLGSQPGPMTRAGDQSRQKVPLGPLLYHIEASSLTERSMARLVVRDLAPTILLRRLRLEDMEAAAGIVPDEVDLE